MDGNRTTNPSRSLVMITWQPNREVSVSPKARSNMSFSSSDGSSILSKVSGSSTITWHVEQAQDPPHAPIRVIMSDIWNSITIMSTRLTFHFKVIGLCDVE